MKGDYGLKNIQQIACIVTAPLPRNVEGIGNNSQRHNNVYVYMTENQ